jgi:hypothetical protein
VSSDGDDEVGCGSDDGSDDLVIVMMVMMVNFHKP